MTKLGDSEKQEWRRLGSEHLTQPPLARHERIVAPTPEAREAYVRFATQAARFYRGDRPVRFVGDQWKL